MIYILLYLLIAIFVVIPTIYVTCPGVKVSRLLQFAFLWLYFAALGYLCIVVDFFNFLKKSVKGQ